MDMNLQQRPLPLTKEEKRELELRLSARPISSRAPPMAGTFNGGRETLGIAGFLSSSSPAATGSGRKKKKNKNQRRFSNDQIRSLESIFQTETKLEPRKKLQLATELGLQPRQVAIWFQNKRARWKSKQLERDVAVLRNNYNSLLSQFDSLNKEKDSLVLQLQKLNGVMQGQAENGGMENRSEATTAAASADVKTQAEGKMKPGSKYNCFEDSAADRKMAAMSSDEDEDNTYLGLKEEEEEESTAALLSMVQEPVDGSLTSSAENWGSLESPKNILDQSGSSYEWWDFSGLDSSSFLFFSSQCK